MSSRENLTKIVSSMPDPRLAMFVISCHADIPLQEEEPQSIYDIPIQAGAALTEKRICEVNDYDGTEDTVSDRNQRYSEMTAMYWIGKNIMTEYVGICHYRRRFQLTDPQLAGYLDKGFDMVTTKSILFLEPVGSSYRNTNYRCDFDLMLEILTERNPDYAEKAKEVFEWNHMHLANMNIFQRDLYEEYCGFIFPILDELYQRLPVKSDTYYRRDVSFLGEWLTSVFVEKKREEGYRVIEVPFLLLKSQEWTPESECDLSDFDAVYEACRRNFASGNIRKCLMLVLEAMERGVCQNSRINNLVQLFLAFIGERKELPQTLFEYLPLQWRKDLDTLCEVWSSFGNMLNALSKNPVEESIDLYCQFLALTGFSETAVRSYCDSLGIQDAEAIVKYSKRVRNQYQTPEKL